MKKRGFAKFGLILALLAAAFLPVLTACGGGGTGTGGGTEDTGGGKQEETKKEKWEEDGVLKILMIGNSFSHNTLMQAYQISQDIGVQVELGILYIGGSGIADHADNAKTGAAVYDYKFNTTGAWADRFNAGMEEVVKSAKWDFISLQQNSILAGDSKSFAKLGTLYDYVDEWKNKEAEIIWNLTWAYQSDFNEPGTSDSFKSMYGGDQMRMYEAIVACTRSQVIERWDIRTVVPAGTAVQNARTSFIGDTLCRDGYHLNAVGEYIAGLTIVSKLTGCSIGNIGWKPSEVTDQMKAAAIDAVQKELAKPFEVTESAVKA